MQKNRFLGALLGIGAISFSMLPSSFAVVGQAERFDRFDEQQLNEFQKQIVEEETLSDLPQDSPDAIKLQKIQEELKRAESQKEEDLLLQEVENLKRQILNLPKRDRFKANVSVVTQYSSNPNRNRLGEEDSDSTYKPGASILLDFSGRRTGLSLGVNAGRSWSQHFPAKDSSQAGAGLNYNRKYFRKLQHSFSSNLRRHNTKTNEIDADKIRWDFEQGSSFNFPLTRKIQLNTTTRLKHRQFTQEAFDQDSSWGAEATPAAFFVVTPKSRFTASYGFGANRIRSKAGDANSHTVSLGYFGKITRKSSASMQFSWNLQTPRSVETATSKRFNMGVGYILQLTPKTQVSLQAIRSQQDTTSDPVPTTNSSDVAADADDTTQVVKNETHFVGENVLLTFNTRLSKKLKAVLTLSVGHTKTKQADGVSQPQEDHEYQFPLSLQLNYKIRKWLTARFLYAFNYQRAFEVGTSNREHRMTLTLNASL